MSDDRPYDVVLFGATGFTGDLTAAVRSGAWSPCEEASSAKKTEPIAAMPVAVPILLRGTSDNLLIRMSRADHSGVHSTVALYEDYRTMAIANGVDPDDPALAPCRGDRPVQYHGRP